MDGFGDRELGPGGIHMRKRARSSRLLNERDGFRRETQFASATTHSARDASSPSRPTARPPWSSRAG